jgi:phosphatidate phosphatase APP1
MSQQEIEISAHTDAEGIVHLDLPTGIANREIQLTVSLKVEPTSEKTSTMRVPGVDEGRFVVPDDFDDPLPPKILKAFESKDES